PGTAGDMIRRVRLAVLLGGTAHVHDAGAFGQLVILSADGPGAGHRRRLRPRGVPGVVLADALEEAAAAGDAGRPRPDVPRGSFSHRGRPAPGRLAGRAGVAAGHGGLLPRPALYARPGAGAHRDLRRRRLPLRRLRPPRPRREPGAADELRL